MGEFIDAALEIAEAFDTDLVEAVQSFTFTEVGSSTAHDYRGVPSDVKQFETDGESVTMTTGKWFCLKHELPVVPRIDDTMTIDGKIHHISRVIPADKTVGWWLYANG